MSIAHIIILVPVLLSILLYALAFAVNPKIAVIVFVGLLAGFLLYSWLPVGMYAVLWLNPFDRMTAISPGSRITITKILIVILALVLVIQTLLRKDSRLIRRLYDNPLTICGFCFLLFSIISLVNAHDYGRSLELIIRRITIVAFYIVIITLIDNEKKLFNILRIYPLIYFFVGLTGFYELLTGKSFLGIWFGGKATYRMFDISGEGIRVEGPHGDPDIFAMSFIFPISLCAVYFYLNRSIKLKLLISGLFCFLLIVLLGTSSRSGLIASLMSLFTIWYFLKFRHKYLITILFVVLLSTTTLLFSILIPTSSSSLKRYTGQKGTKGIYTRFGYLEMAWSAIQKHPILGIGTGHFAIEYNRYINEKVDRIPREPHNAVIQSWAENGIFGLMSYLLLFAFAIRNAYRAIRYEEDIYFRSISVALLATLLGLFFFAGCANVLQSQEYWIIFAFSVSVSDLHMRTRRTSFNTMHLPEHKEPLTA